MAIEDLTTYTESDANNRITETTTRCTFLNMLNADANTYVYKDYGTGFFKNRYIHEFEMYANSTNFDKEALAVTHMMSNVLGSKTDQTTGEYISILFYRSGSGGGPYYIYSETGLSSEGVAVSVNTLYYITVKRNDNIISYYVYSDAARTTLIGTYNVRINDTNISFRYLFCCSSYEYPGTARSSGYSQNFNLYYSCPLITLYNNNHSAVLNMPHSMEYDDGRELQTFNFWSTADIHTIDIGKNTENIRINGTDAGSFVSDAYQSMASMDILTESGEEITIYGTGLDAIDTTWYIENFNYSVEGGMPNIVNWSLTLEKSY
jgi:hypothetical protein